MNTDAFNSESQQTPSDTILLRATRAAIALRAQRLAADVEAGKNVNPDTLDRLSRLGELAVRLEEHAA